MRQPKSLEGPGRFQTSIQISPDAKEILFVLAKRMGVSRTDVLELAIRELAQEYLTQDKLLSLLNPPMTGRRAVASF